MICIPIKQKSLSALLKDIVKAQKIGDIIEVWFDELDVKLDKRTLAKIFTKIKKPVIYKFTGKSDTLKLLIKTRKIDLVDVDIKTKPKVISEIKKWSPKTKIIISYHNFSTTPEIKELKKIIKKMYALKADIAKIATYAKTQVDSLKVLSILSEVSSSGKKIICLAMGSKGRLTRICGHLFGNYLMYAPLRQTSRTADGQFLASELKKIMNLNQ